MIGTRAIRAVIALLFAVVALPAVVQYIHSPHALHRSSLNGAAIRVCSVYVQGFEKHTSQYGIVGWPRPRDWLLRRELELHTGSFSIDRSIRVRYGEFISQGGAGGNTNAIPVFASDPALVVGT